VKAPSSSTNMYLLVPILLLFLLLIVAVLRSPNLISSAGIGSAIIVMTPLALATYALMAVAIAGRGTVDLSVGPLIGFINVTLVQLYGADFITSPLAFFAYAIAVGIAYHLIMGLIIVFVRVQPIIVSLSGYLALSGLNLVILPRPGGSAPEWMLPWGLGTSIFSPILVILVLSTGGWLLFTRTAFYGHLRLMGSDERSAYTSGVRIYIVRLGAHCISGIFSALAALTFTALIGSGDPTQGTTYTLIAVTALVLGGTSLAGGRGGVIGSLLGAVNIFLIGYVLATFSFGTVQGFVTDLAYGFILVISLLLTVALPYLQSRIRNVSPFLVFVVLSLLFMGVILHATYDYSKPAPVVTVATVVPQAEATVSVDEATTTTPPVTENLAPVATATEAPVLTTDIATTAQTQTMAPAPITENATTTAPDSAKATPAEAAIPSAAEAATKSPAPAPGAAILLAPAAPIVATENWAASSGFIFEKIEDQQGIGKSEYARPVTFASIIMISLLILARAIVSQTMKRKMTALIWVIITVLLALGVYVLATWMVERSPPSSGGRSSPSSTATGVQS
jgi:ribose transport system permease protein